MAANDKFNLSAASPDGPNYANGHRGPYSVASFERSGSFRETAGNGMSSSLLSMSKPGSQTSHGEGANLVKSLISHLKPVVVDQKFPRPEVNRVISSIVGISSAQSLPKTIPPRPLPSSSVDDIRNLKNNLHENSIKARDRVKAFGEATLKIEKHCRNNSKKRSRTTSTSSDHQSMPMLQGGSNPKVNPQGHQSASGFGPGHKIDERTKNTQLNRKLQTSISEMDARFSGTVKSSGPLDRVREVSDFGLLHTEERGQESMLAVEGWDNLTTKKKRSAIKSDISASTILASHPSQTKFLGDAKPRVNTNGLRHKGHQDASCSSPTSNTKMNAPARGPRSNYPILPKTAGGPQLTLRGSDDKDPQNFGRQNSANGAINRKRSVSARSPSPPVGNWIGQRPPKISRGARRSNCSPLVSGHHELLSSDIMDSVISNEDPSGVTRCLSSNASRHVKPKVDDMLSGGLSESEESAVANFKSKNKVKKNDTEGTIGQSVQKVGTLLLHSKKRKLAADGEVNDGIPRQRIGRGITSARSSIGALSEKAGDAVTSLQLKKSKVASERIDSKPGRPLKNSERKGYTRPHHSVNIATPDIPGEPVDDNEALFTAAKAAVDTRKACSGKFWKQIQPVFSFLSSGHIAFLNEQIRLLDEATPSSHAVGNGQKVKGDLEYISLPSTPASSMNEFERDIGLVWQTENIDPFLDQLVQGIGSHGGVSICQALLSAIIDEEQCENLDCNNSTEETVYHDSQGSYYDLKLETRSMSSLQAAQGPLSNGFMASSVLSSNNQPASRKFGSNGISTENSTIFSEFEYNQMGINDRILLELRQIGLYPCPMPELAQSEGEDISESINGLQEKLHSEVLKKKQILLNLEKIVLEERSTEQRKLERIAFDRLVWMAYEKYMECWRPTTSSSKSVNKHNRHAALSFATQALARCQKFEENGVNCFADPIFREIFLSISSSSSDTECTDVISDGVATKRAIPTTQFPKQSQSHSLEQALNKEEPSLNRGRKRELLLDDVVDSSPQSPYQISRSTLLSGTKGKRSNREGKSSKDVVSTPKDGTTKIGRPPASNVKGARRNKTKPKQRTTNLSASINDLLCKPEGPKAGLTSIPKTLGVESRSIKRDDIFSNSASVEDRTDDADAAELQSELPDLDVCDFDGNGQDIGSWLNIDEEGMQDNDFIGLEVPMDDLSEVF